MKKGQAIGPEPQKWLRTEVLSLSSLEKCVCPIPHFHIGGTKQKAINHWYTEYRMQEEESHTDGVG